MWWVWCFHCGLRPLGYKLPGCWGSSTLSYFQPRQESCRPTGSHLGKQGRWRRVWLGIGVRVWEREGYPLGGWEDPWDRGRWSWAHSGERKGPCLITNSPIEKEDLFPGIWGWFISQRFLRPSRAFFGSHEYAFDAILCLCSMYSCYSIVVVPK